MFCIVLLLLLASSCTVNGFRSLPNKVAVSQRIINQPYAVTLQRKSSLQMNIFSDAFRFLTNLNKEATARHILMTGPDASSKLAKLKEELQTTPDLQTAFGELASRVKLVAFDI
jgi:hypothetical protein